MTWIMDHKEWLHLTDYQLLDQKGTGNKVWDNTPLTINMASFFSISHFLMDPWFFKFPPLALGQSYDCPSASGGNSKNVSKFDSNRRFNKSGLYIHRLPIMYDRIYLQLMVWILIEILRWESRVNSQFALKPTCYIHGSALHIDDMDKGP